MPRHVFFSFHFNNDAWRASQVRNSGVIDGNHPVRDNEWEEIKKGGDKAVEKWINDQMSGRSCIVVLVGSETANRPWVRYEIVRAWNLKKGVVGIRIHNLKNQQGNTSTAGTNPFNNITIDAGKKLMSSVVTLYEPPYTTSTYVYDDIKEKIDGLVEKAITIRNDN